MKTVLLFSCFLALSVFKANALGEPLKKDLEDADALESWYDDDLYEYSQSKEAIEETNKQDAEENKEESILENEEVPIEEKNEEQVLNEEIGDDVDEQSEEVDELFKDDKNTESVIEEDSIVDDNGEAVESIDNQQNDDNENIILKNEDARPADIEDKSDERVQQDINTFLNNLEGRDDDADQMIEDAAKDLPEIDGMSIDSIEDLLKKLQNNEQSVGNQDDESPIDKFNKQYDEELNGEDSFADGGLEEPDTNKDENEETFYNKEDDEYYNKRIKELVSSEEINNANENDEEKTVDSNEIESEDKLTDGSEDFDSEVKQNVDIDPEILEETKNLLDSINSEMKIEEDDSNKEASEEEYALDDTGDANNLNEEEKDDINEYDELVEKAVDDLQEDLNSLYKTISKLAHDVDDENDAVENDQDNDTLSKEDINTNEEQVNDDSEETSPDVKAYEDENQRPYGEDNILDIRDAIEDAYEDNKEFYDDVFDRDNIEKTNNTSETVITEKAIPYGSDQIFSENKADENVDENAVEKIVAEDVKPTELIVEEIVNVTQTDPKAKVSNHTVKDIDSLTSSEVTDLMEKFIEENAKDLEIDSEGFNKNVAPIHITLSLDEAVEVTSPNFPSPYPTNNIIDWILEGDGVGIEMNLTDFSVNGFIGDYLLVKPGELDDASEDGLIFSYALKNERSFRFLDVNRMFVRFEARMGMAFTQGFRFTAKLIRPTPQQPEPIPQPEPVINEPSETLLVFLGGISPVQFMDISEDFRTIVADMATLYINDNDLDMGANTTSEVTQIVRVSTCNINWPEFASCTGVRFGVPLQHEVNDLGLTEDQLNEMWNRFVDVDPFAARLRRLGVTEFITPNDSGTLIVWLVIGAGVLISAVLLALALWRWTCFEDYTRMKPYSDTDSVHSEKRRALDLYPTPHQDLPPLYDDDFIKYEDSSKGDMTGFTNRNFVRDSLFDESDDDISSVPSIKVDSNQGIQPRDIYNL